MSKIVISEFMAHTAVEKLRARHDVHLDETLFERPADLAEAVCAASALIVRNRTRVTKDLIAAAPALKVVGRLGVGLDNIDLAACKARGVAVMPATGANAASVAEYVVCAALILFRGRTFLGTADLQSGKWPRAEMSKGLEIGGKVLGVIGFGSIGQVTARLAANAGFQVIAHDDFVPAQDSAWTTVERVSFDDLLKRADAVSLHCPLTDGTRGLIGASQLQAMKPGAVLINTARGGIVDEQALVEALRVGHLGGAAIDVFDNEPIDAATAGLFSGLTNVILTPHVAGVTAESNDRISALTAENVMRHLDETNA